MYLTKNVIYTVYKEHTWCNNKTDNPFWQWANVWIHKLNRWQAHEKILSLFIRKMQVKLQWDSTVHSKMIKIKDLRMWYSRTHTGKYVKWYNHFGKTKAKQQPKCSS